MRAQGVGRRHLDRRVSLSPRRRKLRADARSLRALARRRTARWCGSSARSPTSASSAACSTSCAPRCWCATTSCRCAGHELRTPLAALSAQLLGLKLAAARRGAARAQARRRRAAGAPAVKQLVDELLDVSRIVHGKLRLELRARSTCAASSARRRRGWPRTSRAAAPRSTIDAASPGRRALGSAAHRPRDHEPL